MNEFDIELLEATSNLPTFIQDRIFELRNARLNTFSAAGLAMYIMDHAENAFSARLAVSEFERRHQIGDIFQILTAGSLIADETTPDFIQAEVINGPITSLTYEEALEIANESTNALRIIKDATLSINIGVIKRVLVEELEKRISANEEDYNHPIHRDSIDLFSVIAKNDLPKAVRGAAHWIKLVDDPEYRKAIDAKASKIEITPEAIARFEEELKKPWQSRVDRNEGNKIEEILDAGSVEPIDRGDLNSEENRGK